MMTAEAMKVAHRTILRAMEMAGPLAAETENDAFLQQVLEHFAEEEREVYPIAQATGWTGGSVVSELRYQHQTLRQTFLDSVQNEKSWERFDQQIREHFSAEELLVFPLIIDT